MVALLLAGLIGYKALPVAALPQVDYPTIQVVTLYPGASPNVMASLVTSPLERQFGQMPGLAQMSSSSSGGASRITLQFDLDLPLAIAEQEVQSAMSAASNMLPPDLPSPPLYNKVNPADQPVISLAVTSPTIPLPQVRDLIDLRVAQKLSQVTGVGLVSIAGGQRPAVRIQVNPEALAARQLTMATVRQAVVGANVNQPKGNLDGPERSTTISANEQLRSVEDYENLIIHYVDEAPLRLGDIATVVQDAEDLRQAAWVGNQPAILLNVQRQPGANVIEVADSIKAQLEALQRSLPTGIDIQVATDRTLTIRDSVKQVQAEMLMAIALVVLVTLVFLRTWTATFIPSVVVPLSIAGTFAFMYLFGFSINNLTLMALTIATGFVVDDAIVMIENIARYIEEGLSPLQAALKGAQQITFTLISLTLSLIAVLIPLLFMSDVIGRLFQEFAITLAVAIGLSLLISLSLTPMMCARLLRAPDANTDRVSYLSRIADKGMQRLTAGYKHGLDWVLASQTLVLWVAVATLALTGALYLWVPKGFFPQQDTGMIQAISEGPQAASFSAMSRLQTQAAEQILQHPEVAAVTSFIGVDGNNPTLNTGRMQIALVPHSERSQSAAQIMDEIAQDFGKDPDFRLYLQPVQELTVDDQVSRAAYQLALSDPEANVLFDWVPQWLERLQQLPQLAEVTTDLQQRGLQVMLDIDRDAAARLGVSKATIDDVLYDAFGQRLISTIYTQSSQYRVVLEVAPEFRLSPQSLRSLYLPTRSGEVVPLLAIATPKMGQIPCLLIAWISFLRLSCRLMWHQAIPYRMR